MSQATQAPERAGPLPPQRVVHAVGVGLDGARKSHQPFVRPFPPPAGAELQEHIALGVGVKPQVAGGRFAFNFRIEHLHGRFVDLQVAGGFEFLPDALIDG